MAAELDIATVRKLLGNLIATIKEGQTEGVIITRYGKPMAWLGPIHSEEEPPLAAAGVPLRPAPPTLPAKTAKERQAARDALLSAINKKTKS
jgi:antitoxin (DNA-binding transcriptional repressor) of toxin-antitoxin stability system